MKLPFIIIVDDDVQVLRAIQRDVKNHYRDEYRVMATESAAEALELIRELKLKNEAIALFLSDQKMPEMEGVAFLAEAKEIFPEAKRVLLTAYSDIEAAIKAINEIRLDYYLMKPWSPPEEKLYPVLDEILDDWQSFYKPDHEGTRIIGFQWSPKSHKIKEFLSGNLVPYIWMDIETNEHAEEFLKSASVVHSDLPAVILKDGTVLINPSLEDLAKGVGLRQQAEHKMYDVVIIGAGPAGLAASVYGSTEGLKTLLIERSNPGGQASSSSRIENYLGFPTGLSGAELTRRALTQTIRFGTEILTPQEVKNIYERDGYKILEMSDGSEIHSKAVVISTGVAYNKLDVPGLEKFTGAGVYYGAAAVEAGACRGAEIYIVGGGNSACQAAMHLCKFAATVNILIRRDALKDTAANYLVQQISSVPNIKIHPNTEVISAIGDNVLESVILKDGEGNERTVPAKALFFYIGAKPSTGWLPDTILKDSKGFIFTGADLEKEKQFHSGWKLKRQPYTSEASIPGVFASGDVRYGALAGISSAVGEGALAIRFIRKYLQEN
jgi:thioredoxin reductase (NADPH)